MKLFHTPGTLRFCPGAAVFSFLPTGDVYRFENRFILINALTGSKKEGSANNIWLRFHRDGKPVSYPLLGLTSGSYLEKAEHSLTFSGTVEGVSYRVLFRPSACGTVWFWDVCLTGEGQLVDVIYGQDLGMAEQDALWENELYAAQYLGHTVLKDEHGFHVCSRQNLPQKQCFPYLQQGMLRGKAIRYSTDALQFFGLSYKDTDQPAALSGELENRNLQFEHSYTALQSEACELKGTLKMTFYCCYRENHADSVTSLEYGEEIKAAYLALPAIEQEKRLPQIKVRPQFGAPFSSPPLEEAQIKSLYPGRLMEEYRQDTLLSFFLNDCTHVVLKQKELLTRRPHGNIVMTLPDPCRVSEGLLTSTHYMNGVFNSQTAVGNTSKHKALSVSRSSLNLLKNSGQRIYVTLNGTRRLLTLPAVYEAGLHFSRWLYRLENDILQITSYAVSDAAETVTEIESQNGLSYDFLVTHQLVMGTHEFSSSVLLREENGTLFLSPEPQAVSAGSAPHKLPAASEPQRNENVSGPQKTADASGPQRTADASGPQRTADASGEVLSPPGWHAQISAPGAAFTWSDDRIFFEDDIPQNGTLLCLSFRKESHFRIVIRGYPENGPAAGQMNPLAEDGAISKSEKAAGTGASGKAGNADGVSGKAGNADGADAGAASSEAGNTDGDGASAETKTASFLTESRRYQEYTAQFLCGFSLEKEGGGQEELLKLNLLSRWYTHNALLHFAAPHGLEQPGGAAWGTRDVCQGPLELFLALQKFDLARDVLLRVFSHQFSRTGQWPQWFMFDRYQDCQADCHGDVIFWPLKAVGDYLFCTGDAGVLEEKLPFTDSPECLTLAEHIRLAVLSVEQRFLPGTFLISYAGGDWDDTLKPADDTLQENLVSSWTQALAFQVLTLLQETLADHDPEFSAHLRELALRVKAAFERYLTPEGVPAGFVFRSPDGSFSPMLHPSDRQTGIHLRLLPLTRSVIAGLADPDLAVRNMALIEDRLLFPDGVRLMDRPAAYSGGVSRLFRRAEQAANVGREISLQYVHAHIRYIEALCRMGMAEQAWRALFQIIPIRLQDTVPNAALRQSNLYFSSSDGAFDDRYEYSREFERLRDASVAVEGGWRIYSSGPGIFLHRLICELLGVQVLKDALLLDPVLPPELDGLRFHFRVFGEEHIFVYHISDCGKEKRRLRAVQAGKELPAKGLADPYRPGGIRICRHDLTPGCPEIHIYT